MDILENVPYGDADPGPDDVEGGDDTWRHPATLALIAVTLAVLCLFGVSALRGATYTLLLSDSGLDAGSNRTLLIAGAFLSAAIALIPVVVARLGLQRLVPDDGPWVGHVLRAALLLGSLAAGLDLVRALLALGNHDPSTIQVLF